MVMGVFVAGGSGVIGRRLVPRLVARGHRVTATTTGPGKLGLLERLGAEAVVMDGLDAALVGEQDLPCCHRSASAGVSMPRPADEEET
jgi:nucleoside-diphosphate-sugar epimerase